MRTGRHQRAGRLQWVDFSQRTPRERSKIRLHQILKEPAMDEVVTRAASPWNKGKLIGQKARFKLKEI
jgi:hypothetical protein